MKPIDISTASPSPPIAKISAICGHNTRRKVRSVPDLKNKRGSGEGVRLSRYFESIASVDVADYTCGTRTESVCATSQAILGLAAVARNVDTYADDAVPPASEQSSPPMSS
jgi:hypothetical protein